MDGNGAHGVVNLEFSFDPVMQLVSAPDTNHGEQQCLHGMVQVIACRGGDNAAQPALKSPKRIALGHHVANQQAAGQGHEEVARNGA